MASSSINLSSLSLSWLQILITLNIVFVRLSSLFSFIFSVTDGKIWKKFVLTQKQMISTSKRGAEHPFAGWNTQHLGFKFLTDVTWHILRIIFQRGYYPNTLHPPSKLTKEEIIFGLLELFSIWWFRPPNKIWQNLNKMRLHCHRIVVQTLLATSYHHPHTRDFWNSVAISFIGKAAVLVEILFLGLGLIPSSCGVKKAVVFRSMPLKCKPPYVSDTP